MKEKLNIRALTEMDYPICSKICEQGLKTGIATFETKVPDWKTWDKKFLKQCRFVAECNGVILGWIALTPFSSRDVYKGVRGKFICGSIAKIYGVGSALLTHMIHNSVNFWTLQAKIFPQNERSIHLFLNNGFREVGVREKIAMRDGVWYDNILLERRCSFKT